MSTLAEVEYRQDAIDAIYAQCFPDDETAALISSVDTDNSEWTEEDRDLCSKIADSKQGKKFQQLFSGDLDGYPSHSEADLAFCSILGFWTKKDSRQMDRIFRASSLYRKKWDEKRGKLTYGAMTIGKAIAGTKETYQQPGSSPAEDFTVFGEDETPAANVIYKLSDYLAELFPPPVPLIGTEQNAFLVRGEGSFVAGRSGTGKTMLLSDLSIKMATGYHVLKYPVPHPLKVLIYQAELPNTYFQLRLRHLIDAYTMGDKDRAALAKDNIFIADVKTPFNMTENKNTAVEIVGEEADKCDADVVIIDPFLSFYAGDENINPEVRRGLDQLKNGVAEKLGLGIMISDHLPKTATAANKEQIAMRGAGAKHDWAASVLLVSSAKTPAGEHGDFLKIYIDKIRYGPKPRDPFMVRRDINSGLHNLWEGETVEPFKVAKVLDEQGGELSQAKIREAVTKEFEVSRSIAEKFIRDAMESGYISTESGQRGAINHVLTDKYINERKDV